MAKISKPEATATYTDTWFGAVPVELRRVGKGYLWLAKCNVTCGLRPIATAGHAIYVARKHWRFSEIADLRAQEG